MDPAWVDLAWVDPAWVDPAWVDLAIPDIDPNKAIHRKQVFAPVVPIPPLSRCLTVRLLPMQWHRPASRHLLLTSRAAQLALAVCNTEQHPPLLNYRRVVAIGSVAVSAATHLPTAT